MVGSVYEFHPIKTKQFEIFNVHNRMTDDSLLTIEVAKVLMNNYPIDYSEDGLNIIKRQLTQAFHRCVLDNPGAGWGARFYFWALKDPKPYGSYGNGSAMRISPVGWVAKTEEEVKLLSKAVTEITHNSKEGILGAEAIAISIFMALNGCSKEQIKDRMVNDYYPEISSLDFDDLVKHYEFSEICQKSCPQAIYCFLVSNTLEDAIRNCVAIGGDCDTTGAMAGAIAEAFYNKDKLSDFEEKFMYLQIDPIVEHIIKRFHKTIGSKKFE